MNILGHAASAIPFILTGNYAGALGAVAPDLTWIKNEIAFRRSGIKNWHEWIPALPDREILPYRIAHAVWAPLLILLLSSSETLRDFAWGWLLHIALDLPTHSGRMAQQPFFPISWRWKWHLQRNHT